MGSLESVQTVWITYAVVVIWADKMFLEGLCSSTLFALGSQAKIYYDWKTFKLSDKVWGAESWKHQLTLIIWVVILNICNSCNAKKGVETTILCLCAYMGWLRGKIIYPAKINSNPVSSKCHPFIFKYCIKHCLLKKLHSLWRCHT